MAGAFHETQQGALFQHQKGGLYQFVCYAELEADHTVVVVYRSVETGKVWVRPKAEFQDGRFKQVA